MTGVDADALLTRLLAIADDAVIVVDDAFDVVLFNQGAERVFGCTAADAVGRPLAQWLPTQQREQHSQRMREFAASSCAARRMGERAHVRGRRADGSLFDAEASIAHLEVEGRMYYTAILRDVTEARAAASELERAKSEAEAAARAKSLFLANMSHEIRTPLNAVIGMTTLLLDTPMSADQRDFAQTIHASSEALLEIINDILDYSKADVGKLELERRPFDLRRLIEESLDLVTPRALEKGLNLAYQIEDGTPEALLGDAVRLRQILVNLLSNAVKFTHQGEVFATLDGQTDAAGGVMLHVAVEDTGIGIAADHLPRLFNSFTQVDASTTRKYGGTGLGLAISKRLAELMGGRVSVESTPGRGSVFHVWVQLERAQSPQDSPFLQRNAPALVGKRILIVDDNQTNRRILTRFAMLWGMRPSTLPSALEAIDLVRHGEPFDVAVLDMSMPDRDGLDLAHALRDCPGARTLPLVLLTSLGQRPPGVADDEIRFAACLSKPIKAAQLYKTLVAAVRGDPSVRAPTAGTPPTAPLEPLSVLVAEDHPVNQRVVLRLLQHLGHHAEVADNGRETIEQVGRRHYDVVLMDIQMPEVDGLQAARAIVRRRGPQGLPRIIAMTANAMPGDRDACLAAGMDGYLAKPIELRDLAEALGRAGEAGRAVEPGLAGMAIDTSRLEALRSMQDDSQPSLVRELIDLFDGDSASHIERIEQAHAHGNSAALRTLAHRFASATQNIGATRLSALCAHIESLARQGRSDELAPAIARLAHERDTALAALAALRLRY
jgi:PAS domain S-box-containing protein